jgi:hypothetical protein
MRALTCHDDEQHGHQGCFERLLRSGFAAQEAKARVYKVTQAPPSAGSAPKAQLVPVLEEMPKWSLLQQVAEEIQTQRALLASRAGSAVGASAPGPAGATRTGARAATGARENGVKDAAGTRHAPSGAQLREGTPERELGAGPAQPGHDRAAQPAANGTAGGGSVVDLLDSQSPVKRRPAWRDSEQVSQQSPVCDELLQGGDCVAQPAVGEDAHAWINQLSAEQAQACADAPVLLLTQERHMLSELRSILTVRPNTRV